MDVLANEGILVLGHRNPDTDASVSAHAYASFLTRTERYDDPVTPGVTGPLGPQASYVFERAGVAHPSLVTDLRPQVRHVARRATDYLTTSHRLRDAMTLLIRTGHSMLPVLNSGNQLQCVFSHRQDASRFLLGFDAASMLSTLLDWNDLAALPGATAVGQQPDSPELTGNLHIALESTEEPESDDVFVCGSLDTAARFDSNRTPKWILCVSPETPPQAGVDALNRRGSYIIYYQNGLTTLLSSLTGQVRLGSLSLAGGACVGEADFVHDVRDIIRGARHALPVVNGSQALTGVVSASDLRNAPRRKLILVDHFESSQSARGVEQAEILEIVDHHHIGDIVTTAPARVDCRPVGSTSTIIALKHEEHEIEPTSEIATLLLGGLVSDTLCLTGPTTTEIDRRIAVRLAERAGVELQEFGLDVLRSGDDLMTAKPASIWSRDQKVFSIRNQKFAVAQLETVSLRSLPEERLRAFRNALLADFQQNQWLLSLLVVTDVLTGDSWITAAESGAARSVLQTSFGDEHPHPDWTLAAGIVSRKKQVIPRLMQALAETN
jgi:manganese-dependent inorganic pyrophosphatase